MTTLYVIEPGARVEKEYHRLAVVKDDEILMRVPLNWVTQVVLVGRSGVTTSAMHALLRRGISLLMVTRTGRLLGRLVPPVSANLKLRQAQYHRNDDDEFVLGWARNIVAGKIRNQRVLARRLVRHRGWHEEIETLDLLGDAIKRASNAESPDTLLGIEGLAARLYFGIYRRALPPEWEFDKRTRRPPKDPVNALLSLGYTFLGYAMMTALEVVGLDPYLGFFHAEKHGRPALALDLIEEFRSPIVDSMVLDTLSHRVLRPHHFVRGNDGWVLTPGGLRVFLSRFTQKLESKIRIRELGRSISYRKLLEVQARKAAHRILGESDGYKPFRAR